MVTEITQQGYNPASDLTDFYTGIAVKTLYESIYGPFSRPTTFLIDRDGKVRKKFGGVLNHEADWCAWIEELI